jgi:hypothetical protein
LLAVFDPEEALLPGAPLVHAGWNIPGAPVFDREGNIPPLRDRRRRCRGGLAWSGVYGTVSPSTSIRLTELRAAVASWDGNGDVIV